MDATSIAAVSGAIVVVIGAAGATAVQIINAFKALKAETKATAVAVDGRMSAVEKASAEALIEFKKTATEMMAAFEKQVLKAQAESALARDKQDDISAKALADANERGRAVIVAATVAAATAIPSPPEIVDPNGKTVHAEKPAPVVLADVDSAAIKALSTATPPPPEKGRL